MKTRAWRTGGWMGFTLVELLVALVIGVGVITAAVLAFQGLVAGSRADQLWGTVTLGTAVMENFYDEDEETIDVWYAPNYGRGLPAGGATGRTVPGVLRERLEEDLRRSSAVYCLGRNGLNAIRPSIIAVPAGFSGPSIDVPGAFRQLVDPGGGTFVAYRNVSLATNASIFILQPAADEMELNVRAVYDVDLTAASGTPGGTYASVKRYAGGCSRIITTYFTQGRLRRFSVRWWSRLSVRRVWRRLNRRKLIVSRSRRTVRFILCGGRTRRRGRWER